MEAAKINWGELPFFAMVREVVAEQDFRSATRWMDLHQRLAEYGLTIQRTTAREIKQLKKGRSWKFFAVCFGAALAGGLTAVILCGLYWPAIRGLLGG